MTAERASGKVRVITPDVIEGRAPPHDLDAEGAVLSSVLNDRQRIDEIVDVVKADDFYAERHARIFEVVLALRERGEPIDIVTVGAELKQRERIAQIGGASYLTELLGCAPWVANVRQYADIVAKRALSRRVIAAAQRVVALGYVEHGDDVEYASTSAQALHDVAYTQKQGDIEPIAGPLGELSKMFASSASRATNGFLGFSSGFASYDARLAGLHDGDLTIVAARPGIGKTSFALGVGLNVATRDEGVAIFSLEMPRVQVALRLACMRGGIDIGRVRAGKLNTSEWSYITSASAAIAQMPIWIDDTPGLTVLDFRAKLRRVAAELERGGKKLKLAVFDYLQLGKGPGDSREQIVADVAQGLKDAAKEARIAVIAPAQLNREVEKRANGRPQLSDLRESGNIEQAADNIVFIWQEAKSEDEKKFTLAKQRNGALGEWEMAWQAGYARFAEREERLYDGR